MDFRKKILLCITRPNRRGCPFKDWVTRVHAGTYNFALAVDGGAGEDGGVAVHGRHVDRGRVEHRLEPATRHHVPRHRCKQTCQWIHQGIIAYITTISNHFLRWIKSYTKFLMSRQYA